jgi:hypothetical protein
MTEKRCPDCGGFHDDDLDEVIKRGLEAFPPLTRMQMTFVDKMEEVFARSTGSFLVERTLEQHEGTVKPLSTHRLEIVLGQLACVVLSMRFRIAKLEARLLVGDVTEKTRAKRAQKPKK